MRGVKRFFRFLPWMVGMALLTVSSLTMAAQFQADMVEMHRGKTKTNQFYLRDDHYRLDVQTAWVATKYDFPVKLVNTMNGRLMELKNIKEGVVAPTLFQVP